MDTRRWKKVLLNWITQCGFTERNYFNVEQSDIDGFFQNYCRHLRYNGAGAAAAQGCADLASFLQEQYPEFDPNFDDNYVLSSSDYIYVYSLLLHFSCVKYPEQYFHDICQKLSEPSQQCIANFFKLLLDCPHITKETIRHAIADVAQASPRGANDSFTSSCGGLPSPSFARSDSPIKTPKRPPAQRISPSTPKSYLLEERTRELYNLRALLETERYEKGLLEVQIKQNEEKILKLNQDHRKLQQTIQDLKNDILTKNTESGSSPNRDGDEQIKRRLCKEISQKEQEISKLTDILSTLREEKTLVQEKLSFAEKQIAVCMERIQELEYKLDELSTELEKKNGTIKYLTDNKLELEQFIMEIRTNHSRADPNNSMDCMDSSFSRSTNSSGSHSSPENLGRSVIDVQLREKEIENQHLREALANVRIGNNRLAKHIQQIAHSHAQEWQLNIENVTVNDDEFVDPAEHFVIFANCVDKLNKRYKNEQNLVEKLQQEASAIQQDNSELYKRLQQYECDISEMKTCIQSVEDINQELEKEKFVLKQKLNDCEKEVDELNKNKLEIMNVMENLAKEYESQKVSSELTQKEFGAQIAKLQEDMLKKCQLYETLEASNKHMQLANTELQSSIEALHEKMNLKTVEYNVELKALNEKLASKTQELSNYTSTEMLMKDKYEKLLIHSEDLKRSAREADQHLGAIRNELTVKELQMGRLGPEIEEVRTKNQELEARIDDLMVKHKNEMQTSDMAINKKEEMLRETQSAKEKLQKQLEELQGKHDELDERLKSYVAKINDLLNAVEPVAETGEEKENVDNDDVLAKIELTLKQVHAAKEKTANKIECLEFDNIEYKAQIRDIEGKLQRAVWEKEQAVTQHNSTLFECKTELKMAQERIVEYEAKLEALKEKQTSFIENLEKQLQGHLPDKEEQTHAQQLEAEYKDHHQRLERELKMVIGEHNIVKAKLLKTETEYQQLKEQNQKLQHQEKEKLQHMSEKLQLMAGENEQLVSEISQFKLEHEHIECTLKRANSALEELSEQLKLESAKKDQLNVQLRDSEVRLQETEKRLQGIIKDKHSYEDQMASYRHACDQIKTLDQVKRAQAIKLEEHKQKIKKLQDEKEQLQQTHANVCKQVQREQSEKAVLLRSLEKTADQLKLAVDEKAKQAAILEQRTNELQEKVTELTEQNKRLQSDLVSKETEATLQLEEIDNERAEMQSKLMQKIAEQAEQMESNDVLLIEILNELENHTQDITRSFSGEAGNEHNIFNTEEPDNDTLPPYNQLKQAINKLTRQLASIQQFAEEAERKRLESKSIIDALNSQLTRSKAEVSEIKNMLSEENKSTNSKLELEVQRLNDDLNNVTCVNVKLSQENATLQQKMSNMVDDLANVKLRNNILSEEQRKMAHELSDKQRKFEELQVKYEAEMKTKSSKIATMEDDLKRCKETVTKLKVSLHKAQLQNANSGNEMSELNERLMQEQEEHKRLVNELNGKKRELATIEEQWKSTKQSLEEANECRHLSECKHQTLQMELQKLQRDVKSKQTQLKTAQDEITKLTAAVETVRNEKDEINNELKENKRDLQRANENVTELIQQIASIRMEKEGMLEELQQLRKQFEEHSKYQNNSESKLKTISEHSHTLEQTLLTSENELKALRAHFEKSEQKATRLEQENKKLRENHEASTKRVEKMALKLGDAQARSSKLEREQEKLSKIIESNNNALDAMQREKDSLQSEAKALKERLTRGERSLEQLTSKLQTLEQSNAALEAVKTKLEAAELDVKSKLLKLEKMRDTNDEKIRKLNHALNTSEQANVRLNLEIGALNSQLNAERRSASEDRLEQSEEIKKKLIEAEEKAQHYEKLCDQLESQVEQLRSENTHITDQLSKVSLSLEITKKKCDQLATEMDHLRSDVDELHAAKLRLDAEHNNTIYTMKQQEEHQKLLLSEQQKIVADLEVALTKLQNEVTSKNTELTLISTELTAKNIELADTEAELLRLRERLSEKQESNEDITAQCAEAENLRTRLAVCEALLEKEQTTASQLRADNQILQAKYKEAKQRLIDESLASEERIKENRLELEGKLEKMKNKMKTLYTEEIAKIKLKQDRETASTKSELEVLKAQNVKYEEHTRKLSAQVRRLNENILDHQKQNALLTTKLKHVEDCHEFKRPSSIHVTSSTLAPATSSSNLGTNLAMEDEEGEVFNNTYLADLKNGCMNELMSREICPEELQYRNSLLPPHLQSTYAAQYDHGLTEEDLKDGPHALDDSMSALLSTTVGGTRKKISGATSYKRPGPPTPSKNGGRLSFGGISEPPREILKESSDSNAAAVTSSSKTPARFKIFSSRFSMGNAMKDEPPMCSDLRKAVQKKNFEYIRMVGAGAVCTSTPRKSKSHYDQRRLLDELIQSPSITPSPASNSNRETVVLIQTPEVIGIAKIKTTSKSNMLPKIMTSPKQDVTCTSLHNQRTSMLRLSRSTRPSVGTVVNDPKAILNAMRCQSTSTSSECRSATLLQRCLRRRLKRVRGTRPSLYLRGNIFAKHRTPTRSGAFYRDLLRCKARRERMDNFNKFRMMKTIVRQQELFSSDEKEEGGLDLINNNYSPINRNPFGETMVLMKHATPLQLVRSNAVDDFSFSQNCSDLEDDDNDFDRSDDVDDSYDLNVSSDLDIANTQDLCEYVNNGTFDKPTRAVQTPIITEIIGDSEQLVSSMQLQEFDRENCPLKSTINSEVEPLISSGSSKHFHQLLKETKSHAPFEINQLKFDSSTSAVSSSLTASISNAGIVSHTTAYSSGLTDHNSRTIYGGSVIYNRKIPNVNTTLVRKSSIYIKRQDALDVDIILLSNQTITILDLFRMWRQMSGTVRLMLSLVVLASSIAVYSIFVRLFLRNDDSGRW